MASTTLSGIKGNAVANLGTNTFNVLEAGVYKISCRSLMNAPTALIITINKNGSQLLQSGLPAITCREISLGTAELGNIGDNFTVVLSSSNANDAIANNVMSTITVSRE